jgi:hypothetical protein
MASRRVLLLLARFALVYGVLVALCALLPVYVWIERAATVVADVPLHQRALEARSLRFEPRADPPAYVYELRIGAAPRELRRAYHKHGFVLVLIVALVLATPGLALRRRVAMLAGGSALAFLLCVAMLMSDVEVWEHENLAASNLQAATGPYLVPLGWVRGLHRTAAAGILPVILWVFLVSRAAREKIERHIVRVSTPVLVFWREGW